MSYGNLNVFSVFLLLIGCGGGEFSTAGLDPGDDGTSGSAGAVEADAGAAGATQGTGGVTGVTGGLAGVTGGSTATGGTQGGTGGSGAGGQQAGSGGDSGGAGGSATGGQQAATGGAAGGAGGATCKPPRLMPEDLPQTVVWKSYLGTSPDYLGGGDDLCVGCQQSPCTTCSLSWWPIDQSADGITVTAKVIASGCTAIPVNVALCSKDLSASSCTTWNANGFQGEETFQLLPKADGTGYRAVHRTSASTGGIDTSQGSCFVDARAYDEAVRAGPAFASFWFSIRDGLIATEWPCGS